MANSFDKASHHTFSYGVYATNLTQFKESSYDPDTPSVTMHTMIYYVEDDPNIADLTMYALRQAGLEVVGFSHADSFEQACKENLPDAILLDIMLPGKDGLSILRDLKADPVTAHIPVMMLSAKSAEIDKVTGIDLGADDYLAKPYGMMELVSRTRALLRRAALPSLTVTAPIPENAPLICGAIKLDQAAHRVWADGVEVMLTRKEFDLLLMLIEHQDRVLSRSQLLEHVWGWEFTDNTRTVDVHVQTLRQKLGEASTKAAAQIETIRGVGYTLRG